MPDPLVNTSIKQLAFYGDRKNPFSVATLFGQQSYTVSIYILYVQSYIYLYACISYTLSSQLCLASLEFSVFRFQTRFPANKQQKSLGGLFNNHILNSRYIYIYIHIHSHYISMYLEGLPCRISGQSLEVCSTII